MKKLVVILLLIINLNTATQQELRSLPGIGPVLASRIIEFRQKRHGFKRVEELLAIPGISEKKWKAIRDQVRIAELSRMGTFPSLKRRGGCGSAADGVVAHT